MLHDDVLDIFFELPACFDRVLWIGQTATGHRQPLIPVSEHSRNVRNVKARVIVQVLEYACNGLSGAVRGVKVVKRCGRSGAVHGAHLRAGQRGADPPEPGAKRQ